MCGQKAAMRRRKQSANNFAHMAPMDRPIYHKMSVGKAAANLARVINNERKMKQKPKK